MTVDGVVGLQVLDPTADVYGEGVEPLSARLTSLEGKTLGLVWNAKPNGDVALKRTGELISERVPGLTVRFYSGSLPCSPELLRQAAEECDAVLACTAD
jgi:hypothetical protein